MSELIEFWRDLGFLDGVDEEKKERLSREYQKVADFLTAHETEVDEMLFNTMFPIVRKIVSETNNTISIKIDDILNAIENAKKNLNKLQTFYSMDFEAELCCFAAAECVSKYNSNKFNDVNNLKL